MSLAEIRKRIDAIDEEILSLLHRRFRLALRTRTFKTMPHDPSREREILGRVKAAAKRYPLLRPNFLLGLYKEVLRESRRLQARSGREIDQEKQR